MAFKASRPASPKLQRGEPVRSEPEQTPSSLITVEDLVGEPVKADPVPQPVDKPTQAGEEATIGQGILGIGAAGFPPEADQPLAGDVTADLPSTIRKVLHLPKTSMFRPKRCGGFWTLCLKDTAFCAPSTRRAKKISIFPFPRSDGFSFETETWWRAKPGRRRTMSGFGDF